MKQVFMWEFGFTNEANQYEEVCYYTYTNKQDLALSQFQLEEPGITPDYISSEGSIPESFMIEEFGDFSLVLDS